jgi:hypothetical protein
LKWTSPGFPTVVVLRAIYQVFLEADGIVISPDVACPAVELAVAYVASDFELVEPSAVFLFVIADVVSEVAEPVVSFAADASVADVA